MEYQLDASITQPFWDNSVEPRLTVSPGDVVTIECAEPIGQVTPEWTDEDFRVCLGRTWAATGVRI